MTNEPARVASAPEKVARPPVRAGEVAEGCQSRPAAACATLKVVNRLAAGTGDVSIAFAVASTVNCPVPASKRVPFSTARTLRIARSPAAARASVLASRMESAAAGQRAKIPFT
ncbi:MAG TPA: hypothetical protein VE913_14025 [Longimicrobium sp.]|nr:hypothetical protein [Longimicrobium sp.]